LSPESSLQGDSREAPIEASQTRELPEPLSAAPDTLTTLRQQLSLMQQSLSLMQQSMLVIQDILLSPQPKSNATLSQEGLSPPELDTDLQYKEARPIATSNQEGLSPPELDTDLQYKEAHPKKPSATQLTDQVPLNTEVTALAHLPVRLWMTQNPTKSSVNRLTIQMPLTTEVTNPVSTENYKGNSTIICKRTMMPGKVYGG
jgi:hypothetical protein